MNLTYLKTRKKACGQSRGGKKDSTTDKIGGGHLMVITSYVCGKSLEDFKQVNGKI